jgi:hypothetical protein
MPSIMLRLEGLALFVGALIAYGLLGQSWGLFALLLLSPDLAALGYLVNKRVGNVAYNLAHTTSFPILLAVGGLLLPAPVAPSLALIWLAHIGMDRTVGYGLKYTE